jgi:hypothetical protein
MDSQHATDHEKGFGMGLRRKKSLMDQAGDYVEHVKPQAEAALESAREFVHDTVVPALADAKDKAGPALSDAKEKAAPVIAAGAAMAAEKATAARDMADAKVAEPKSEPAPKKKKGKLKRFVLFAAIAGAVAAIAKKLQGAGQTDSWQSSYTPSPPPPTEPEAPVEDPAGASPDEALSDASESPHAVSTPDEPADVVDVDEEEGTQ